LEKTVNLPMGIEACGARRKKAKKRAVVAVARKD
jgi:hypothetical protein